MTGQNNAVLIPEVSVIMPVGSVDSELEVQLLALSEQTFRGQWELVLSINTPEATQHRALDAAVAKVADSIAHPITIVDSSSVRSASHARNVGASVAAAPLLTFCDSDDIVDPAWLNELVQALNDDEAVGGFLEEQLLAVSGQEHWRPPATPGDNPSFLGHPFLVSANMGVTAEAFKRAGGFDERLLRGEDIAFSWALLRLGIQPAYCADAVVHYRHRKGLKAMLRQHYLYGRGMAQILRRHGTPDGARPMLAANGQAVERQGLIHIARRGSIAVGRVVGLVEGLFDRSPRSTSAPKGNI